MKQGSYLEILSELPVVSLSVQRLWFLTPVSTLDASVDDHDRCSEPWLQPPPLIIFVRSPGSINHMQHAWLGWLRIRIEPCG